MSDVLTKLQNAHLEINSVWSERHSERFHIIRTAIADGCRELADQSRRIKELEARLFDALEDAEAQRDVLAIKLESIYECPYKVESDCPRNYSNENCLSCWLDWVEKQVEERKTRLRMEGQYGEVLND